MTTPENNQLVVADAMRKLLWIPPTTKEHLHNWVKVFLGIDLPNCTVYTNDPENPPSDSNPMDILWDLYCAAKDGTDPTKTFWLYYAARDSFKSLIASIMEAICLFPLRLDVAHCASIESQAKNVTRYLKDYLKHPILAEFVTSKNERTVQITRYTDKAGNVISPRAWDALDPGKKNLYSQSYNYVQIVVATLGGTNSLHVDLICVDGATELYVKNPEKTQNKRSTSTASEIFNQMRWGEGGSLDAHEIYPIVLEKNGPQVLSLNLDTGTSEFKTITRATKSRSNILNITSSSGKSIKCTSDHPLFVIGRGFVQARELKVNDRLLNNENLTYFNPIFTENEDTWEQVLIGTLMGDSEIDVMKEGAPHIFLYEDKERNGDYYEWRKQILARKLRFENFASIKVFKSGNSPSLLPYLYVRDKLDCLDLMGPQALAIWYMESGWASFGFGLHTECWNLEDNNKICDFLRSMFDLDVKVHKFSRKGKIYWHILGGVEAKKKLSSICKDYVYPSLAYKFNLTPNASFCKFCNKVMCTDSVCKLLYNKTLHFESIVSIVEGPEQWVYDFTVEGNNNFWSNKFLSKNCLDELDLAPPAALSEAMMMTSQGRNKNGRARLPLIFMTSTRKFLFGPVQKAIDDAKNSDLNIRHWNMIDVSAPCPPERHLPLLPKISIYTNSKTLKAISKSEFDDLPIDQKNEYKRHEGYQGCLKNCKIFGAGCLGQLATNQHSTSPLLKSIDYTQSMIRRSSLEKVKSQILCQKPSAEGLVYPRLDRAIHMLSAAEIAKRVTGDDFDPFLTKNQLVDILTEFGGRWVAGIDWGYVHPFAVVIGYIDGTKCYIVDVIAQSQLDLSQKLELCDIRLKPYNAEIFADPAYPSDIATFKKAGYRMRKWSKSKGTVAGGIDIVRMKLMPPNDEPELFFLDNNAEVNSLFEEMSLLHYTVDQAGNATEEPAKEADDLSDSCRYLIMNVFAPKGKLTFPEGSSGYGSTDPNQPQHSAHSSPWEQVMNHIQSNSETPISNDGRKKGGKGRFKFDLG